MQIQLKWVQPEWLPIYELPKTNKQTKPATKTNKKEKTKATKKETTTTEKPGDCGRRLPFIPLRRNRNICCQEATHFPRSDGQNKSVFFQAGLLRLLSRLHLMCGDDICGSPSFMLIFFSSVLFIAALEPTGILPKQGKDRSLFYSLKKMTFLMLPSFLFRFCCVSFRHCRQRLSAETFGKVSLAEPIWWMEANTLLGFGCSYMGRACWWMCLPSLVLLFRVQVSIYLSISEIIMKKKKEYPYTSKFFCFIPEFDNKSPFSQAIKYCPQFGDRCPTYMSSAPYFLAWNILRNVDLT